MSAEVQKEIDSVDNEMKTITLKKIKLEQQLKDLQEKKEDLKDLYHKKLSEEQDAWETWCDTEYPWKQQAQAVLLERFHLQRFRKQQLAAINATLFKQDTIVVMPTGGGKSLCYQLPALLEDGLTLVVSPLISLMEDQVYKLNALNILAYKLTASEPIDTKKAIFTYLHKGIGLPIKLLYISPEMFLKSKKLVAGLQNCHKTSNLTRIAIDEVHCCSEWGHDFRPDYRYLGLLRDLFPDVPMIGLTATATTPVLNDVREILNIPTATIIKAPFDRENLLFKVLQKPSKYEDCISLIHEFIMNNYRNCSGIIYTNTIKECDDVGSSLRKLDLTVRQYHAQLDNDYRQRVYEKWINNKYQIVVATIAFGLGIDKPDVRFVIHFSVPKTIEDLYQQGGRAGRDGEPASCILLYKLADYLKFSGQTKTRKEHQRIVGILNYVLNRTDCRHALIGTHFEEEVTKSCKTMCDNCLKPETLKVYSLTRPAKEIYQVVDDAHKADIHLTLIKLLDAWYKTYKIKIPRSDAETVIAHLLKLGVLTEEKSYTSYTVICYLKKGFETLPKGEIVATMPQNAVMRTYLGIAPALNPTSPPPSTAPESPVASQSKKRAFDMFCEPSTSKVKVERIGF